MFLRTRDLNLVFFSFYLRNHDRLAMLPPQYHSCSFVWLVGWLVGLTEREFTYHYSHPSKVCNSVVFSIFTRLCDHHHCVQNFHHPRKKLHASPSMLTSPHPLFCEPSAASPLLSVSGFACSYVSHTCSHTIRGLLCLASCTKRNVFMVHQVIAFIGISLLLWLNSIPLYGYTTVCVFVHQLMDI